ncbi:ketoreductase sphI [Aspergillus clavatus NRRL 1]|uniref:Reductase, putative n=1 Tax=Aspergillus clavatus (strain ATCC 1007 / CBS 513.65 / DSM 816 / NCTC 3887 / NRRL 1 / QM 1276 / 107) TaxID=344612 RepID=A1C8J6_ASPCL|nr:reductase, putative [Aspergillus clavatus NRRL 1]EAW13633.1 reductase, putative [Aspergillus clavatus NRRL 1]
MTGEELVFITGASGFIGSCTALALLRAGYRLRILHRQACKIERLQALLSEYSSRVEYALALSLTDKAAYREHLDGVNYIIHLAHPLPSSTEREAYFVPAVRATTTLLEEAARVPSIKKVVITSSVAALMPLDGVPPGGIIKEDNDWDFTFDETEDFAASADPRGVPMRLYHASKLLANRTAHKFRTTAAPSYALVTLHPVFVYGHNPTQNSAEEIEASSNGLLWYTLLAGVPHRCHSQVPGVHIDDVVEAHVRALDPGVADGSRYLLSGPGRSWKEVAEVVQREYPDLGARISTDLEEGFLPMDGGRAEKELGLAWRSWEAMVRDVVEQQLGFAKS